MNRHRPRKNTALLPTTRLASGTSFAPTHCATSTVDAMENPNKTPNRRNMITFELPTAANAVSPRNFPTQMAFTEPFTDCRTFPSKMGIAKTSKARGIDPSVKDNLFCKNSPLLPGPAPKSASHGIGIIIMRARPVWGAWLPPHDQEETPMLDGSWIGIAACVLFGAGMAIHPDAARAATDGIPDSLKAPAGQVLSVSAHGSGVQIYTCTADKDDPTRFVWSLKGPEAVLSGASGKILGKHYGGPTWEATDGSKVIGEAVAKADAPGGDSIPWLLLHAKSTSGTGVFAAIVSIQRVRTSGGKAPGTGCDKDGVGHEARVPYSADYLFYTTRP